LVFLEGANQIIPALESALSQLKKGDKKTIQVEAKEAYGLRSEELVIEVPVENLSKKNLAIGDEFQIRRGDLDIPIKVIEVNESHATLDANHPMAGIDLTFNVEIMEMRKATEEEIRQGPTQSSTEKGLGN